MSRYRGLKIVFGFGFVFAISCVALLKVGRQRMQDLDAEKDAFVQQFVDQGYAKTVDDAITVRRVLDGPIVLQNKSRYKSLNIHNRIDGDAALVANSVVVAGHIDGDLDFFAASLEILGSGSVSGDIRSGFPAKIKVAGTVGGEISGEIKEQEIVPPAKDDDSATDSSNEKTARNSAEKSGNTIDTDSGEPASGSESSEKTSSEKTSPDNQTHNHQDNSSAKDTPAHAQKDREQPEDTKR